MTGDVDLLQRLERWITEDSGHLIFAEQLVFALQRLLVLNAPAQAAPGPEGLTDLVLRALLAVPEAIILPSEPPEAMAEPIPLLLRNGGYNDWDDIWPLVVRYHRIWGVHQHEAVAAGGHIAGPIREMWYERCWGRPIREDQAAMLATYELAFGFLRADAGPWLSSGKALPPEALLIAEGAFTQTLLADRGKVILEGMSSSRDEYASRFAALGDGTHAAAWSILPFAERPLWRTGSGTFCPISPRLLVDWGTSGVFHRLGQAGERLAGDGGAARVRALFGWLVEQYARSVLAEALGGQHALGARVIPPQPYARGQETTDAIVPWGNDTVLFEVVTGGLTQAILTEADAAAAERKLRELVVGKVRQVARVAADLRSGRARAGPLANLPVGRAFPVVVMVSGITQTEPVRAWIEEALASEPRATELEPFLVLDLGELEELAALLAAGHSLTGVLERALAPEWRAHGFSAWLQRSPDACTAGNLAVMRWLEPALVEVAETLFGEEAVRSAGTRLARPPGD
ncbi:MAG: hypothetical protein AB1416_01455 [Actinomycetota bacterium]